MPQSSHAAERCKVPEADRCRRGGPLLWQPPSPLGPTLPPRTREGLKSGWYLPAPFVRTGLKLSTILPGRVSHRLSEKGIDLSHLGKLDDEALIAALAELQVDIDTDGGEKVRVFCE